MKPLIATVIFTVLLVPFGGSAQADTTSRTFALHDIIGLAIERNPMIAGAMATIDQSTGKRTAAGAYPNPIIHGDSGKGYLKDGGSLTADVPASAHGARDRLCRTYSAPPRFTGRTHPRT